MREITTHKHRPDAEGLGIKAGEPGPGGAPHCYIITGPRDDDLDIERNPALVEYLEHVTTDTIDGMIFQHGGIPDNGVNGVTNEALLAIVADRLECFEAGPFPSAYNAQAAELVRGALWVLHQRTRDREACGVEGREQP